MLPYAAYLRVYEPVTAFPEPARTLWTAYAESRRRPKRIRALGVEHLEALHRLAADPPEVAPELESQDAYVRRAGDALYICPWGTRLRSWLAYERFREQTHARLVPMFAPPVVTERVERDYERWKRAGRTLRPHILTSTWHVPLTWFVPFASGERCLLLGDGTSGKGKSAPATTEHAGCGPTTAATARTLIYVTAMAEARRRVEESLRIVRTRLGDGDGGEPVTLGAGRLEELGRWLSGFHPRSLVELDYGGLVHLLDDRWLRADASVAETAVALAALERGEVELAVAMSTRLLDRWRPVRALESAN
ncbi:hypothetical protein ABZ801_04455 [Actinomadura sp. NPDC047616]|uniref:hypothetical protein n=1 Tax=Actinomadura sp. NPDC047616 TaxID=3155914 RepID=UPI0033ED1977